MFNIISQQAIIPGLFAAASLSAGALIAVSQPSALATAPSPSAAFPDTQGHWAQPFIQSLAAQNIVVGYPDGTFRPEAQMGRDEFSAIVRSAFDQPAERQIPSGAVYTDVPSGYWAVPAIEEAAETGFVQGYPDGTFRPQQPITKAGAIVSLAQNLNLEGATSVAAAVSPVASPVPQASPAPQPAAQPRTANRRRATLFPLAITSLMQPLVNKAAPVAAAAVQAPQASAAAAPSPAPAASPTSPAPSVTQYYEDANQIPPEAIAGVAAATRAGLVVNYPNPRQLNPNQPASRGEVAALIHQALVTQGRTAPIANNPAANYIVQP
jgi:S-layer homology domain